MSNKFDKGKLEYVAAVDTMIKVMKGLCVNVFRHEYPAGTTTSQRFRRVKTITSVIVRKSNIDMFNTKEGYIDAMKQSSLMPFAILGKFANITIRTIIKRSSERLMTYIFENLKRLSELQEKVVRIGSMRKMSDDVINSTRGTISSILGGEFDGHPAIEKALTYLQYNGGEVIESFVNGTVDQQSIDKILNDYNDECDDDDDGDDVNELGRKLLDNMERNHPEYSAGITAVMSMLNKGNGKGGPNRKLTRLVQQAKKTTLNDRESKARQKRVARAIKRQEEYDSSVSDKPKVIKVEEKPQTTTGNEWLD